MVRPDRDGSGLGPRLNRGWRTVAGYLALAAVATMVSLATTFPGFELPAFSALAGVNAAFVVAAVGWRRRVAWAVSAGATVFVLRLALNQAVASAAVVAVALTTEALVFAALAGRPQEGPASASRMLRAFAVSAAAAATGGLVVAAGAAVAGLDLGSWGSAALVRTGADLTGILAVVPLIAGFGALRRHPPRYLVELAAHVALIGVALYLGFASSPLLVQPYLPVALLLFSVVRLGRPAATVLPVLWAPMAIWYAEQGYGPWVASASPLQAVLGTQLYNLTAIVVAWLVAALIGERGVVFAEVAAAKDDLEVRVAARTAELSRTLEALNAEMDQRSAAEARFRVTFTDSASVMLIIDPVDGAIVDANRSAAAFYGRSVDELQSLHISDINDADPADLRTGMEAAAQGRRRHFAFRHRQADGRLRDVEVHTSPVQVDGRTLLYSIVHDVTDAKRDEAALRISEQRFRSAFDNALLGMAEISLDGDDTGRYLHVNEAFSSMTGYSSDELRQMTDGELTHPDDREVTAELLGRLVDGTDDVARYEKRFVHRSGRVVWAQLNLSVLNDGTGGRYGIEHIEDVTERHQSEELLDLMFNVAIDPLAVAAFDGRYVRLNAAFERTLGWTPEELMARPFIEFVHPDDVEPTVEVLMALASGEPVIGNEARIRCKDGSYRWLQWNTAPLADREMFVTNARDVTSAKQAEAELVQRALYDPLTGLANRQLFHDRLRLALDQLERKPGTLALCYLDLDRFKDINDSLGHEAGDRVLTEVARRLVDNVRTVDTVARLAGDEFVLICPDIDEQSIGIIANRLLAALGEPVDLGGRIELGASIGIAIAHDRTTGASDLLRRADTAMYHAKRRGRNRWELYSEALHRQTRERSAIQADLREALHADRFRLHYQPVIDLRDGHIMGAEALLRLEHPTRGLVGPGTFIDIAEDSELIVPIGQWVLDQACQQGAQWNEQFGPFEMAVNLSGRQIAHATITDGILSTLEATGLDPHQLCVEMTERVLIDASHATIDDLRRLTDHGIHLAIDDFGTGYSSLTYLKQFPVDIVKIDRSFVTDLDSTPDDTAIVDAITSLALNLRLTTVAEGVESRPQLRHLRALQCHRAQGFLFHQPATAEDVTSLLEAQAAHADRAADDAWRIDLTEAEPARHPHPV